MSDRKAVIKNADMSEEMQQDAVDCATQALEKYNIEKDIAAYIKKEFDKKYNPTWHCIVGRNFGSYVTHETRSVASQRINSNPQWDDGWHLNFQALHLLLPGPGRYSSVQEWINDLLMFSCLPQPTLHNNVLNYNIIYNNSLENSI